MGMTLSYSYGKVPMVDLGVVDADLWRFASFSSSLQDVPSSAPMWSNNLGKGRSCTGGVLAGFLCLLLLPVVGWSAFLSNIYIFCGLLGLVRSQQSLWALTPLRVLPRSDHDLICKANRLSLLLVTVWRYLPSPAQSRLRRANRKRPSDIFLHCFQMEITRSAIRSLATPPWNK